MNIFSCFEEIISPGNKTRTTQPMFSPSFNFFLKVLTKRAVKLSISKMLVAEDPSEKGNQSMESSKRWIFLSRFCTQKCQTWFSKTSDPAIILTSTRCLKRCGATSGHKVLQQPTCMHTATGKQRMRHRKLHTKLQLQVVNQCHCL